jgi:hypothetical protein
MVDGPSGRCFGGAVPRRRWGAARRDGAALPRAHYIGSVAAQGAWRAVGRIGSGDGPADGGPHHVYTCLGAGQRRDGLACSLLRGATLILAFSRHGRR